MESSKRQLVSAEPIFEELRSILSILARLPAYFSKEITNAELHAMANLYYLLDPRLEGAGTASDRARNTERHKQKEDLLAISKWMGIERIELEDILKIFSQAFNVVQDVYASFYRQLAESQTRLAREKNPEAKGIATSKIGADPFTDNLVMHLPGDFLDEIPSDPSLLLEQAKLLKICKEFLARIETILMNSTYHSLMLGELGYIFTAFQVGISQKRREILQHLNKHAIFEAKQEEPSTPPAGLPRTERVVNLWYAFKAVNNYPELLALIKNENAHEEKRIDHQKLASVVNSAAALDGLSESLLVYHGKIKPLLQEMINPLSVSDIRFVLKKRGDQFDFDVVLSPQLTAKQIESREVRILLKKYTKLVHMINAVIGAQQQLRNVISSGINEDELSQLQHEMTECFGLVNLYQDVFRQDDDLHHSGQHCLDSIQFYKKLAAVNQKSSRPAARSSHDFDLGNFAPADMTNADTTVSEIALSNFKNLSPAAVEEQSASYRHERKASLPENNRDSSQEETMPQMDLVFPQELSSPKSKLAPVMLRKMKSTSLLSRNPSNYFEAIKRDVEKVFQEIDFFPQEQIFRAEWITLLDVNYFFEHENEFKSEKQILDCLIHKEGVDLSVLKQNLAIANRFLHVLRDVMPLWEQTFKAAIALFPSLDPPKELISVSGDAFPEYLAAFLPDDLEKLKKLQKWLNFFVGKQGLLLYTEYSEEFQNKNYSSISFLAALKIKISQLEKQNELLKQQKEIEDKEEDKEIASTLATFRKMHFSPSEEKKAAPRESKFSGLNREELLKLRKASKTLDEFQENFYSSMREYRGELRELLKRTLSYEEMEKKSVNSRIFDFDLKLLQDIQALKESCYVETADDLQNLSSNIEYTIALRGIEDASTSYLSYLKRAIEEQIGTPISEKVLQIKIPEEQDSKEHKRGVQPAETQKTNNLTAMIEPKVLAAHQNNPMFKLLVNKYAKAYHVRESARAAQREIKTCAATQFRSQEQVQIVHESMLHCFALYNRYEPTFRASDNDLKGREYSKAVAKNIVKCVVTLLGTLVMGTLSAGGKIGFLWNPWSKLLAWMWPSTGSESYAEGSSRMFKKFPAEKRAVQKEEKENLIEMPALAIR